MKNKFKHFLLASFMLAFFACETDENLPFLDESNSETGADPITDLKLNEFLKRSNLLIAKVYGTGEYYILDNCIQVLKTGLENFDQEDEKKEGANYQSYTKGYVDVVAGTNRVIRYRIDTSIPTTGTNNWATNIDVAMNAYSNFVL